jgi:hypothetical protein
MPLSIFALGMALPSLITRDLASNAIVIYSSKAVTRGDYLLGKFCTAFGVMSLTWLGPVCGAWFVGNLLAPDWKFFWHARIALVPRADFRVEQHGHPESLLALGFRPFRAGKNRRPPFGSFGGRWAWRFSPSRSTLCRGCGM